MKRVFFCLALISLAAICASAQTRCFTTIELDGNLFVSGADIPVLTASVGRCEQGSKPMVLSVNLSLERLEPVAGVWLVTGVEQQSLLALAVRQRITVLRGLGDGRYRLSAAVNGSFIDRVYFAIGSAGHWLRLPEPFISLPYVTPMRVVVNGYVYFRGVIGKSAWLTEGYLYQPQTETTEIMPAVFEQIDPQDDSVITNQEFLQGGSFDLPWVRVRLLPNQFVLDRPIFVSITADGGGATIQAMAYDPTDPAATVTSFEPIR